MICKHPIEDRVAFVSDPDFCPFCMHEEIGILIAANNDLIEMVRQLRAERVGSQSELPPSSPAGGGDRGST